MNETTNITETAIQPMEEMVEPQKPYTFKRLSSPDVFPMLKIIGTIGVNEFTACFENDVIVKTMSSLFGNKDETDETEKADEEKAGTIVGISVALEIANVICGNLPKCESYIYQLLSQTSNLSVDEIKSLDMVVFFEMIVDFIKKEEFKDFIKVALRLLK